MASPRWNRGAANLFRDRRAVIATLGICASALAKPGSTVWLCKPGLAENPCKTSQTSTVVTYEGSTRHELVRRTKGKSAAVDCFYVYPTVSEQEGPNADLTIEPQETQIAIDQASRFSQLLDAYEQAPDVTRRRLYLDTVEGVMSRAHKVIVDGGKGGDVVPLRRTKPTG